MNKSLEKLIDGYKKFKTHKHIKVSGKMENLAQNGQKPKILFITCSDSRISIKLLFNNQVGDLFILRNIGNFIPPYSPDNDFHSTAAAIEYAVCVLHVENIIICGHTKCGAIEYLYNQNPQSDIPHVNKWITLGNSTKEALKNSKFKSKEAMLEASEKLSIQIQLKNLLTYPQIEKMLKENKLELHGWYYDISDGALYYLDAHTKEFVAF